MIVDRQTKLDALLQMIAAKMSWLDSFSGGRGKRPDHEILVKRREVEILKQIADDYRGEV